MLQYLYQIAIKSEGETWVSGDDVHKATNLGPSQINDAIELLQNSGLVECFTALGTAPYNFESVKITAKGKQQIQKRSFPKQIVPSAQDPRKVFVVHGRNLRARDALFEFLRSIDLRPLEWSEIVAATGKAAPYIGEILDEAFSQAQAVVVLMTPDDEGRLKEYFRKPDDLPCETELSSQARLNVLFEAGMAMGRFPDRTILVELGVLRPFSDIGGRHVIKLNNTPQERRDLAQRLETAGCAVNLSGTDWLTAGEFAVDSEKNGETLFESLPFILQRFKEVVEKPVKSNWSIRIMHPEKPIEKCIVLYDGIPVPWWDKDTPYYERTIVAGGGGNARIPVEIEKEDADVKIMDGKRLLRHARFIDIVTSLS